MFHFPGDAEVNYIKRLVGLPDETLRVYEGDLLVGPPSAKNGEDFKIARKPPDKVLAMRQLVHDSDYDPAELYAAGWPLRWQAEPTAGGDGWHTDAQVEGKDVREKFTVDRTQGGDAWLRYHHTVANDNVWNELDELRRNSPDGVAARFPDAEINNIRPQLVMDFNAYNTRVQRGEAERDNQLWPNQYKLGMHWVGDLTLDADVEITNAKGELLLDLVEAGKHFTCRIDLATGQAKLGIDGIATFAPQGQTPLSAPGKYHVAFANVDDQLLLWAGKRSWRTDNFRAEPDLVTFDQATVYDASRVFASVPLMPVTSNSDAGDLAPAGIGHTTASSR